MDFTSRDAKIEKKRLSYSKPRVITMIRQQKLRKAIKRKTLLSRPRNISMTNSWKC